MHCTTRRLTARGAVRSKSGHGPGAKRPSEPSAARPPDRPVIALGGRENDDFAPVARRRPGNHHVGQRHHPADAPGRGRRRRLSFRRRRRVPAHGRGARFAEYATVFDHRYGTPAAPVSAAIEAGRDILFDIDWQGTQQLHQRCATTWSRIFLLPPSMDELERRLRARGTDSDAVIAERMRARQRARSAIGPNMTMCWSTTTWTRASPMCGRSSPPSGSSATARFDVGRLSSVPLGIEQLQEPRRGEEIAAAVGERLLGLRIGAPLLDLPALVDADRVPRLLRRHAAVEHRQAPRPATRRSSPAATVRRAGTRPIASLHGPAARPSPAAARHA